MELVKLGKIVKIRGIRGEFKILSSTYFGDQRYKKGKTIYVGLEDEKNPLPLTVKFHFKKENFDYVQVEEIGDTTSAEQYVNCFVYADKNDITLEKDTYFFGDLENCKVFDEDNNEIGLVSEVVEYPAQITLIVTQKDGKKFQVPFIEDFLVDIDIENKKITIHLVEGML
ncbi:MAG: ribosome maturation factor RimM [Coprobacillus sp.]|nr:ribosome maturation factor RimM [Coprobacillus sp.]